MNRATFYLLFCLGLTNLQAQNVQFQDPKSETPVNQERTLIIRLPKLQMERITIIARDPFVSAEVKDPYVTDAPKQEQEEQKRASGELVLYLEKQLKDALSSAIEVTGVSSGEPEKGNYALIEGTLPESEHYDGGGRLRAEGDTLTIVLQGAALQKLQEAVLVANQQGFLLDIGVEIPELATEQAGAPQVAPPTTETPQSAQVEVVLKKIDRRSVVLEHTATGKEFEVQFKRDLRIRPPAGAGGPGNPPNKAPNKNQPARPPKI